MPYATQRHLPVAEAIPHEKNVYPREERMEPIANLLVPAEYQRALDEGRVAKMAEVFDANLLERITCNTRPGDPTTLWVVDGQHRLALIIRMGWTLAPVSIHHGWSAEEERERFAYLNSVHARKGLSAFDLHKAGGAAARRLDACVEKAGFIIAPPTLSGKERARIGAIVAIKAVQRIWNAETYGASDGLSNTLFVIKRAWGTSDPSAVRAEILLSIHRFLQHFHDDRAYTDDRLILVLKNVLPERLVHEANLAPNLVPGRNRLVGIMARLLQDRYNYGLRGDKVLTATMVLPSVRSTSNGRNKA